MCLIQTKIRSVGGILLKTLNLSRTGKTTNIVTSEVTSINVEVTHQGGGRSELRLPVSSNPKGDTAECLAAQQALVDFAEALIAAAKTLQ